MRKSWIAGAGALIVAGSAPSARADGGGTIVLNTYNKVLPQLVGDGLGPTKTDKSTGATVPRVGRCTGVGYMDPQLKLDDSPTAAANFGSEVSLLITATRTDNQLNARSDDSYMQGAFSVVKLTAEGPQVDAMKTVALPRLDGDRAWQKPNVMATNKYYLLVAASEDNTDGLDRSNNPQVVAFVYDKATLAPVKVVNSNRNDSTAKPTNLIELSGQNDGQQYGPHSIARVQGTDNAFVLGVQRDNDSAYVLRVDVVDASGGVNLNVKYLSRVIREARHCRPDVVTNAADGTKAFLTSVEANSQPADVGVRVLSFDVETGKVIMTALVAKSDPVKGTYAVQPNIADLGKWIGVSYQMSEKTRKGYGVGDGEGHTGGSNVSTLLMLDKATLQPVGAPMPDAAPYARHAGAIGALWGEAGKEMPAILSLGGSATGTGKGFVQIVPVDVAASKLGAKDPLKLYQVSTYSDVAGTVVRGKRNPNDQGRGFIYAAAGIPNPGYQKGNNAFMPEVKTLIGAAVQGYTNEDTAKLAARESIWLSLVPASWQPGQSTTPGTATDKPGTNPDGTGPMPRAQQQGTSIDPNASGPTTGPSGAPSSGGPAAGPLGEAGGCAVAPVDAAPDVGAFALAMIGVAFVRRRSREREALP